MAELCLQLADYSTANSLLQRSIRCLRGHVQMAHHPLLIRAFFLLGQVLHIGQARYRDSITLHTYTLQLRLLAVDEAHPGVALSLCALGDVDLALSALPSALQRYQEALALQTHAFGCMHCQVADALEGIGRVLVRQGQYVEATLAHQRALTIRSTLLEPHHTGVSHHIVTLSHHIISMISRHIIAFFHVTSPHSFTSHHLYSTLTPIQIPIITYAGLIVPLPLSLPPALSPALPLPLDIARSHIALADLSLARGDLR